MNNLTTNEKKVLNNMSQTRDLSVLLGDKLDEVINSVGVDGTPVNAVAAAMTLAVTGVVVDGETVTINNPAVSGQDVFEFVTNTDREPSVPTNIPVYIGGTTDFAQGVLIMDTQPTPGDTVTIGEQTYIFVPVGTDTAVGEVSIGADLAGAQAALVAAIKGLDEFNSPHPLVRVNNFAADEMPITALRGGTAGNAIATTSVFSDETNAFDAVTLEGGTDCSAANAIESLVIIMNSEGTQGVSAADGTGDTVNLTADVAGTIGNNITISETMANAAFTGGATKLAGGVDGTVSNGTKFMVDDTYLYVSLGANTTADANWRRIAVGDVY